MHAELKKAFDQVCNLFDKINNMTGILDKTEAEGRLSDVLRFELMSFMMCLSACDSRISRVEAQLIREYFGLEIYPVHIKEIINEHNIGDSSYFQRVPESLKLAVKIDSIIAEQIKNMQKGIVFV